MKLLDEQVAITRARRLVEAGFRTKIVCGSTNVSAHVARKISREICGTNPTQGLLPDSFSMARTWDRLADTSIFVLIYIRTFGDRVMTECDAENVLDAWHLYRYFRERSRPTIPPMTVNEAWVIARDVRSGGVLLGRCPDCGFVTAMIALQHKKLACALCQSALEASQVAVTADHLFNDARPRYTPEQ